MPEPTYSLQHLYDHGRPYEDGSNRVYGLTNQGLQQLLDKVRESVPSDTGISASVAVQIGGKTDDGTYRRDGLYYSVLDVDAVWNGQAIVFELPVEVAEHFRQQGRRALQLELRSALNAARA